MKTESVGMNIPSLSVGEAVELMTEVYVSAINTGMSFRKLFPTFLWGPAGVGKSGGIYKLADNIDRYTGKKTKVTEARLITFTPSDLVGIPYKDQQSKFTVWLKPKIFDMDPDDGIVNILFLDELNCAAPAVLAAAYQICYDRCIGEHRFPENCIVVGAGNRVTDMGVTYKMPKPLCNRLQHFEVRSDYEGWREWAVDHDIDHRVIAFLGMDNSRLCIEPESTDIAFGTPRSWEAVSNYLSLGIKNERALYLNIAGVVGNVAAMEFKAFCEGVIDMPSVDDILEGKCRVKPKSHSVMYALISALVCKIKSMADDSNWLDDDEDFGMRQLNNAVRYVSQLPADFTELFLTDIKQISGVGEMLKRCEALQLLLAKRR